jgi:molybdate transport repressor ModE-like protein
MAFQIQFKVWVEKDGEVVLSSAREQLLKEIEKEGSINKAAKKLGISYKKAWLLIKNMEDRLGFPILEKKRGGKEGGGSKLTAEGKKLLENYRNIIKSFTETKNDLEKVINQNGS